MSAALLGPIGLRAASAQTSSSGEGAAAAAAPMEQRALDLLRRMSDRLAGASSFSVWARGYREIPATTGQMLTFANTTEVTVRRPDRMRAEVTGDLNFRFWYDGASIAVLDAGKRFYARADAPPRLDEMLSFAVDRYGVHFPLSDFLVSDPYAVLTKGLTSAFWVGRGVVDGVETDHLAFAGPGVQWQVWIESGERALPRRLAVTYPDDDKAPRFLVELSGWNLGVAMPDSAFRFEAPTWAEGIEFLPRQ
jgi:hypothetical protein